MPTTPVSVRMAEPLYSDVCAAAEQRGMQVSAWMRDAAQACLTGRPMEVSARKGSGPSEAAREGAMLLVALGHLTNAVSAVEGDMAAALADEVRTASRVAVEYVARLR